MKVRFVDLKRQLEGDLEAKQAGIRHVLYDEIAKCMDQAQFIMGPQIEKFEKDFASYCGTDYCIALNSGTDAVEFGLRARNLPKGGHVITVPNSYFTSASSIIEAGHQVRFVDVDPRTKNMDPSQLERAIDNETRAIIPVHMYGLPANMDRIMKISEETGIPVIEDCAHAHGAIFDGKKMPYSGEGAFSFFPAKNLGAFGDAGALVTNDSEIAQRARLLRNDGARVKYVHEIVGRKARMDTIQAAILSAKLPFLDAWNEKRRVLAEDYNDRLIEIPEIRIPSKIEGACPVYHVYDILTDRRDELRAYLEKKGIETNIHYPIPIHMQPAFKHLGLKEGSFPVSEMLSRRMLSLPMFPELRLEEVDYVCDQIREFYSPKG